MALQVEGSRDEQPHAGGDSMPLSQGLLPEVGPWRKSLHSFAGACGLSMGVWEFFSLVLWLSFNFFARADFNM